MARVVYAASPPNPFEAMVMPAQRTPIAPGAGNECCWNQATAIPVSMPPAEQP
jgi:hypothetical protein